MLTEPESVWVVLEGRVDLFMVRQRGGEPSGARHHTARIHKDRAFFGVDWSALPVGWGMLIVAAPGTQVFQTNRSRLMQVAADPTRTEEIHRLIEDWIATLSQAVARDLEPRVYIPLEAGGTVLVPREPKPLLPKSGVVWVRHIQGQGLFLGNADLPAIGGDEKLFPLAAPAWLQEQPLNQLSVISTGEALQNSTGDGTPNEAGLDGINQFQYVAFSGLIWNFQVEGERERQRLIKRQKAEDVRLDRSIRQLSIALRRKGTAGFTFDDEAGALMSACYAIGAVQGIEFRSHPDVTRSAALKDPVAAIARASGVRFRKVVMGENWWKREGGPLLAFRESDARPIALLPRGSQYDYFDPVEPARGRVDQKLVSSLQPFAFAFYRSFPATKIGAKDLLLFGVHGSWRDVFVIVLMGLLSGLLGMAMPILTQSLFDTIIPGAQRHRLLELGVFIASASISSVLFQLTRGFATLRLEGKMEAVVQAAVWDRLLKLPVPFFRKYSAGDLAMRGLSVSTMRQILTGSALSTLFSGVFSVFSFALLFYYSRKMALVATGLTLVALLFTAAVGVFQVRYQREMAELRGKIAGTVLQFILGIAKFRVSGTESRAFMGWAAPFSRQKLLSLKSRRVSNWQAVFNSVFPLISSLAIFWIMAYLMSQPDATPLSTGEFLAFNSAYGQFSSSMLQLTGVAVALLGIVPLYERARPILETVPEVDPSRTWTGELAGSVEISHAFFRYAEDGPLILKDVSIDARAGEFIAIVGPSGSGKSTLFRLLLGFEKLESGAIFYDGQDVASLDVQTVRQQMGVVMQNASLFSGDIYSNIVCSAPYSIDEAWEAARLASLDKDLKEMPMGMHTIIGDGGAGLSGGQRQRLMIARAIVGKPRILLFDEATSALDNETQAVVAKSLDALKATRIVIAHRLSTVANANRVFVMEHGEVVQKGTYAELINQEGLFAELAKRQLA